MLINTDTRPCHSYNSPYRIVPRVDTSLRRFDLFTGRQYLLLQASIYWYLTSYISVITVICNRELINSSLPSGVYMRQWIGSTLVQIIVCRLFGAKPFSKPMLGYCQLALGTNFSEIFNKIQNFSFTNMHLKTSSAKWPPFCPGWDESKLNIDLDT